MGYRTAISNQAAVSRGRLRRYEWFARLVRLRESDTIVDVGCGTGGALERFNRTNPITAVDLIDTTEELRQFPNVMYAKGDGCNLPFPDRTFDVAFCNSVIEHVPTEDRERFSAEIRRVAGRYYVQTPNKWFPIEPHYMVPLVQFLPWAARGWLNGRFRNNVDRIELLDAKELQTLFPDATIYRERFWGLTKSLLAVRA